MAGDRHTTDLAMLRGARLVSASETEQGGAWNGARIKQATGGDPITARFMRENNFTFMPAFKLLIVGNYQPQLRNVDDALRRRFNIVPFTRKPTTPDTQLEKKLMQEGPAILRWMIQGHLEWRRNGLRAPATVRNATASYFIEQDQFGQWLAEECTADQKDRSKRVSSGDLYESWRTFADRNGEKPGSIKSFSENIKRRGFAAYRTASERGFEGIQLGRRAGLRTFRLLPRPTR